MTLDKSIVKLEKITDELVSTKSFDDAVALYKKGIDLAAACSKQLDAIQQTVTTLSEENGKLIEKVLTNDH
jgi:exodeoxyribonuclease VII small subunit